MTTEKLYYKDSYIKTFTATVVKCEKTDGGFAVILDKTAFFPEGGGQKPDTGKIGGVAVFDVQESDGVIKHFVKESLAENTEYTCEIDWDQRFSRMQNHSGEHIVSGVVHALYGYDNIGFHMEEDYVTVDFNGELSREQLDEIEDKANEAIYNNVDIICFFPEESILSTLDYRSKLELVNDVRLVKIADVDLCACCAPHVSRTGEIGVIKILDFMRHRGGVRIVMKSGHKALLDYREKYKSVYDISVLLSAKQTEISKAVDRLKDENDSLEKDFNSFRLKVSESDKEKLVFCGENIAYYISSYYDADMMRSLANYGMTEKRLCVILSGNDADGFSYIAGSLTLDMSKAAKVINSSLNGRGGGRGTMIQGKVTAEAKQIIDFFNDLKIDVFE